MKTGKRIARVASPKRADVGFSLIELMVAMAIFLVIGGTALTLVRKHATLFSTTQNQTGVNLALRNAVAQMENDVVNAGAGFYPGANSPFWPVGVTVQPATTPGCNTTGTYTSTCFDQMTIITANTAVQVTPQPSLDAGATTTFDPTVSTTIYLTYPDAPSSATLATRAATFQNGGEILLVKSGSVTPQIRPLVLTANGTVDPSGKAVQLQVAPFSATSSDLMGIYDPNAGGGGDKNNAQFDVAGTQFGPGDFAINLVSTKYSVNNNNQLVRQVGNNVPDLVADRIVGFSVSPFVAGAVNAYDPKPSDYNSDWTLIRAVNIKVFARTPAFSDANNMSYKNNYDGGNYQVQGVSVVINPRNLSMDN
jgi:prepilin-type N-terminal cleavage/methylation domain-containing protein